MNLLLQAPLRRKLNLLAMTCSVVALAVAAVTLGVNEYIVYRRAMFSHLRTLTQVTARNSAAAVAFANTDDAARILAALESEPAVVAAILYDSRGHKFAEFRRPEADAGVVDMLIAPEDGLQVHGTQLELAVPVAEAKRFGTLLVVADVSSIWTRLGLYGIVLLCTTIVSVLLAYLLTGWIKERIVGPVQALAAAAFRVQTNADYNVRVPKEADDELGALTEAFNAMLARIQQNEAEIARSAERLRLAVDAAQIGTWDWDLAVDRIIWNERNHDLFGLEAGAPVTSVMMYERIHAEDRERVRAALNAAMHTSTDFATEFRIAVPGAADRIRYVVARGRFLRASSGGARRSVGVMLDITDRRMAELRAIESELRFRAVAERAPAMIWSCDAALHRDYFNKTWLVFTGRPLERETGDGWQEGVPRADLDRWREIAQNAAAQRDPYSVEYRLRRADGSLRWVVETGAPRLAADGAFAGYLGSCTDITTRKETEEELEAHVRRRTRELEVANQELESFSYSVSHDLRGPVRAIQGFAEIAIEEIDANNIPSAKERVDRVIKAADRMNKLIDAFIGMARVSRAQPSIDTVNLSKIAEEVAGFLRISHPERLVNLHIAPGLTTRGDERLLRIVMENLFSNAWKFTSRQEDAQVEFGATTQNDETVFFVRDNGAGFDPNLSHKLFQAFERLHSASHYEGLGVGLSTVYRIIEKHGGRIWAESRPNAGATFYFTLNAEHPGGSAD